MRFQHLINGRRDAFKQRGRVPDKIKLDNYKTHFVMAVKDHSGLFNGCDPGSLIMIQDVNSF